MKHWESYQTWKIHRNPARAELERQHGYDTKHAMHLIRLMRMGLEVLETGDLSVRRDDADELSAISRRCDGLRRAPGGGDRTSGFDGEGRGNDAPACRR